MADRQSTATSGDRSLGVGGDNHGVAISGDGASVHFTKAGAVFHIPEGFEFYKESELPLSPTQIPFEDLLGRDDVTGGISEALAANRIVEVVAADGWGKTSLLKWLIGHGATDAQPHGIVWLEVGGRPVDDVAQSLFRARYVSQTPGLEQNIPFDVIANALVSLNALVIVDDIAEDTDVERLVRAAAKCGWVLGGPSRKLRGQSRTFRLAGLDVDAATLLVEDVAERPLAPDDRTDLEGFVDLTKGRPQDLVRLGDDLRQHGGTLADAIERVGTIDLTELGAAAREAVELLKHGRPIPDELLGRMVREDGPQVIAELTAHGLMTEPASPRRLDPAVLDVLEPPPASTTAVELHAIDELTAWASEPERNADEIVAAGPFAVALVRWAVEHGEYRRAFDAARAMELLLPATAMFGVWRQMVELAGVAARQLSPADQAWALHQAAAVDGVHGRKVRAWWRFRRARRLARRAGAEDVAEVADHNARFFLPVALLVACTIAALGLAGGTVAWLWPDDAPTRGVAFGYGTDDGPPWLADVECESGGPQVRGGDWNATVDAVRIPTDEVCSIGVDAAPGIGGEAAGRFGRQAAPPDGEAMQVTVDVGIGLPGSSVPIGPDRADREVVLRSLQAASVTVTVEARRLDGSATDQEITPWLSCPSAGLVGPVVVYAEGSWESPTVAVGTECSIDVRDPSWAGLEFQRARITPVSATPVDFAGTERLFTIESNVVIVLEYGEDGNGPESTTTPGAPTTTTGDTTATTEGTTTTTAPDRNLPPIAVATASPSRGTGPLRVTLDGSGSEDPERGELRFRWTSRSPDGTSTSLGSAARFDHTFTGPGTHEISLTVTDDTDQAATTSVTVEVTNGVTVTDAPPVAAIRPCGATVAGPLVLDGRGSSDPEGGDITYDWAIGRPGGPALVVSDRPTVDTGLDEAGAYVARLTVTDPAGQTGSTSCEITVADGPGPTALIDTTPRSGEPGVRVTLDGSRSADPRGGGLSYDWTVTDPDGTDLLPGDDDPVTLTLTLATPGAHIIDLTVTDVRGVSAIAEPVTVVVDPVNAGPTADISVSRRSGTAPLEIQLDGTRSADPDGDDLVYDWTVTDPDGTDLVPGDDDPATLTLTLVRPGAHTIQLTVTDPDGLPDDAEPVSVLVTPACTPDLVHRSVGLVDASGTIRFGGTSSGSASVDRAAGTLTLPVADLVAADREVRDARLTWVQVDGDARLRVQGADGPPTSIGSARHEGTATTWEAYELPLTSLLASGTDELSILGLSGPDEPEVEGAVLTIVTTTPGCLEILSPPETTATDDDGLAWVHYDSAGWACRTDQPRRSERRPRGPDGLWPSSCSEVVLRVPAATVDREVKLVVSVAGVESLEEQIANARCRDHELVVQVGDGPAVSLPDAFGPDDLVDEGGSCERDESVPSVGVASSGDVRRPDLVAYPGGRWSSVELEITVPADEREIVLELISEKALNDDSRNALGASGLLIGRVAAVVTDIGSP